MQDARFADRRDAGRQLARRLSAYVGRDDVTVLGLPRGGLPVADEVARQVGAPLDVFLVRKLGVPVHPELAMGAIAEGGVEVLDEPLIRDLAVSMTEVRQVAARQRTELERRSTLYRAGRAAAPLEGRTVILVDDGLATGSTMHAAVLALRQHAPSRVVVAVPVGSREAVERLAAVTDEVVCLSTPVSFYAVGQWYVDFSQTTDEEVGGILATAAGRRGAGTTETSGRECG